MTTISHDPVLRSKVNHFCKVVENTLEQYDNPGILCSFGKDSFLMLTMIREMFNPDLPVVFIKQPHCQRKYDFGDKQAKELELTVYSNIPPMGYSITSKNGKVELVQHFSLGQKHLLMPIGRQDIENPAKRFLCGRKDFLEAPTGNFIWPWDVMFCGHKSSDVDPLQGNVELNCDILQLPSSCHLAYPLRHFTDEDIWALYKHWNLPFNRLRYKSMELPDTSSENIWNEDYFPYCAKCLDPNEPESVECPKTNLQVTNISSSLPLIDPKFSYIKQTT